MFVVAGLSVFFLLVCAGLLFFVSHDDAVVTDRGVVLQSGDGSGEISVASNDFGIAAGGAPIYLGQADLDIYFKQLSDLGVGWVRFDIPWKVVEPKKGTYNWTGADRVVNTAKKYGIQSLVIINYAPAWAAKSGASACDGDQNCAPKDPVVFGGFAAAVAARYKSSVSYFEIWNEPNYISFWMPKPNVADYAAVLKSSYTAIKKANPNAVVIGGALAPSGDEADGSIAPVTFIKALYSAKGKDFFDALSLHPYTYPASPDYVADWNSWQQIATTRQIMVDNGDSAKKIWLTEYGAPTGGPGKVHNLNQLEFEYGSDYMSEAAQQQLVQKALELYQKDKAFFGPFFWYSLKDEGMDTNLTENFFGLLRYDGGKKPAYDTFRNAITTSSTQQ